METIKPTTKTSRRYLDMYARANCETIYQAYKTPSTDKARADYQCRQQMAQEKGHGYKIISYNRNFFFCGMADRQRAED